MKNQIIIAILSLISLSTLVAMQEKPQVNEQTLKGYLRNPEISPITIQIPNKTQNLIAAIYKNGQANQGTYGWDGIAPEGTMRIVYGMHGAKIAFPDLIIKNGLTAYILRFEPADKAQFTATLSESSIKNDEISGMNIIFSNTPEAQSINVGIISALIKRTLNHAPEAIVDSATFPMGKTLSLTVIDGAAQLAIE